MGRLRDIAGLLAAIMSLVACTVTITPRNAATAQAASPIPSCPPAGDACFAVVGTDPVIVIYLGGFGSNLMPLHARLQWIDTESCLVVQDLGGSTASSRTFIPLWPEGTQPVRASDGRRGVAISHVGQIFEGDLFRGGGSDFLAGQLNPPIPQIPAFRRPPGKCSPHDGYFVLDHWGTERLVG